MGARGPVVLVASMLVLTAWAGCLEFFTPQDPEVEAGEPTTSPSASASQRPTGSPSGTPSQSPRPSATTATPTPTQTPSPSASPPTTHTVRIGTTTQGSLANWDPQQITIKKGDSVQWDNRDSAPHTATATDNGWNTGNIDGGEVSAAIKFSTAGTFTYRCSYHPNMAQATVTVQG